MSENNEANGFAAAASGKSPEEIAFELVSKLKGQGVWGERNKSDILDMYAECLDAAKGLRSYPGQNRVEVPIKGAQTARTAAPQLSAAPQAAPAQTPPVQQQQRPAAPQMQPQAAPPQMQHAPQTAQMQTQPVHAQQQSLHQAFKPG